jgi:hypothetical protein
LSLRFQNKPTQKSLGSNINRALNRLVNVTAAPPDSPRRPSAPYYR